MEFNGFIKLHRKMEEWEWAKEPNTFVLFIHLLLLASWKDSRWRGQDVVRGSLVTSLKHLSQISGLSVQCVRTSLEHLKSTGEITIKSTNRFTVVTVINYGLYQDNDVNLTNELTSQLTNNQQTTNKQLTTSKEYKEYKEYKNIKNIKNKENEMKKKIELPFSSEKFSEAWERWKTHRTEIHHKLTPSTERSQLKKLSEVSEDDAIAMIDQSIEHGWQGLFPVQRNYRSPIRQTKQGLTGFLTSIDDIEF